MEQIKMLIGDPDPEVRQILVDGINKHVGLAASIQEITQKHDIYPAVQIHRPDVLFLDIFWDQEPIFSILDQLKVTPDTNLVFVTTHTEFALEGYRYHPLGFIIKPVAEERLKEIFERIDSIFRRSDPEAIKGVDAKITVADSKGLHVFHVNDIMYCIGERNYTTFKLYGGDSIMISKTLKYFDDRLSDRYFFRAHKSNLINLNYVKMVTKEDGGVIRMLDQSELPVSRAKKKELFRRLSEYS